ncbi:MAG: V-type ATP synthase subunit D [Saprospiraceae bacterium]|nr:V-type ATP synthase subunit D [Saprospiraceae bacterium]
MAIKFQYNKTSLQELNKQLKTRQRALPVLKNKEAALRTEVKKARQEIRQLETEQHGFIAEYETMARLWAEFDPSLVSVCGVKMGAKKIAGVSTPLLQEVEFEVKEFSFFNQPHWFMDGIEVLKKLARTGIEKQVAIRRMHLLEKARKKATQKVNLYEKNQIPAYESAILKIKRFMEDEENLAKSAQKILKNRQQQTQAAQW